jgi:hypothetical protein
VPTVTEQLWKSRERAFLPTLDLMARVAGPHCSPAADEVIE